MESGEDELGEDETDWKRCCTDMQIPHPTVSSGASFHTISPPQRVILHFDLDCYYAQVEMIRNPELRNVPLGIQQKYIIVTCNYVARDHGVTKLMSVNDAKEKCPQLVLVKGENLTHYREMSYKVTELLTSYCPLVERLGLDENFVDVTELVESRLAQTAGPPSCSFKGHVYHHAGAAAEAAAHSRLALGSHVADEMRAAMHSKLGLTGCAGVATNKLLAKLVSGTFKPNQQTTLLPENVPDIMGHLSGLHKVPGIGYKTTKKLEALGLVSVQDLQLFPLADLEREIGPSAHRLKNLALGVDDAPVTPTGAPQSLSDEDSFKKMSSTKEVLQKIQDLLGSLVERMYNDGRQPQTFRLTIRRYSATNKWFSRESRQCPIPNHIGQKITSGTGSSDAVAQLVTLAMKLFHKMVNSTSAFHLTLLNVCFTNLPPRGTVAGGKGSITSFFRKTLSASQNQDEFPQGESSRRSSQGCVTERRAKDCLTTQSSAVARRSLLGAPVTQSAAVPVGSCEMNTATLACPLPSGVDPEVFRLLPQDIQRELLSPANPTPPIGHPGPSMPDHVPPQQRAGDQKETRLSELGPSDALALVGHHCPPDASTMPALVTEDAGPGGRASPASSSDIVFPHGVDPKVFSELPLDVQRDLVSEWRQQRSVSKTPSSKRAGRNPGTKDRKSTKGIQANNLLKYFKPG